MRKYIFGITAVLALYLVCGLAVYPLENKADAMYSMPPNGKIEDVKIYYWDKRQWYKNSELNRHRAINMMVYRIFFPMVWLRLQTVTLVQVVGHDGTVDFEVQ